MIYLADVTTLQFEADKCRGCGRCAEVCPQGVFVMENRRAVLTDRDRCMECGACALNCDQDAIHVNEGVGCASALINAILSGGEPSCGCDGSDNSGCS